MIRAILFEKFESKNLHPSVLVSTKIATEVFKDGDLVEVDATRGIVRKV